MISAKVLYHLRRDHTTVCWRCQAEHRYSSLVNNNEGVTVDYFPYFFAHIRGSNSVSPVFRTIFAALCTTLTSQFVAVRNAVCFSSGSSISCSHGGFLQTDISRPTRLCRGPHFNQPIVFFIFHTRPSLKRNWRTPVH